MDLSHPWPHLKSYFGPVISKRSVIERGKTNIKGIIACKICNSHVSFNTYSLYTLKRHYSNVHPAHSQELTAAISAGSRRGSKRGETKEAKLKRMQQTITGLSFSDYFASAFNTTEERKLNAASSAGGSLAPGFDENSAGSGDVATGCDEVSVPLSPEQFLSEDMDHASPATPSSQRPESYKLRHNNHLTLVLESLAGDESFMDVTLTAQGKSIKAHKSVLSAVSPYFRGVLKQNPCQHPIIIMPRDMKFDELSNIISYIYKGEMTVAAEDLSSLLKTAEVLQVTGLSPSEGSSGPSSIISQMQGLPTGVFPSTSTKPSKNVAKKHSKSTAHHSQPPIEESFRASPASQVQTKVDPNEFLAADMTCVKEEIQSENEDAVDATFLPIETVETEPNPPDSRELSSNIVQVMDSPSQSLDDPTGNIQEHTNDDYPQDPLETSPSPSPTPYVCPHCLETHRPQDVLHSHLRLKHPSKPSFICSCGKVFVRHSIFIDHRKGCAF